MGQPPRTPASLIHPYGLFPESWMVWKHKILLCGSAPGATQVHPLSGPRAIPSARAMDQKLDPHRWRALRPSRAWSAQGARTPRQSTQFQKQAVGLEPWPDPKTQSRVSGHKGDGSSHSRGALFASEHRTELRSSERVGDVLRVTQGSNSWGLALLPGGRVPSLPAGRSPAPSSD